MDELKTNENLKVDVKYYLSQQIHPVVSRLCDPIEGTDAARIAECLGESAHTQTDTSTEFEGICELSDKENGENTYL